MARTLRLTVDLGFGRGFVTRSFPVLTEEELDARIAAFEAAEAEGIATCADNDAAYDFPIAEDVGLETHLDEYAHEFETEGQEEKQYALY